VDNFASLQNLAKCLMKQAENKERRLAILVDCDNVVPEIMTYTMQITAGLGRCVIRRGYGNVGSLTHKWQSILVNLAFTPCLQYPYAAGKNASDMALALDALEIWFERRVDAVCIISSDSDFTYLGRKLREWGARVYVIGETKTPAALRNACDQFFEWIREEIPAQETVNKPKAIPSSTTINKQSSQSVPKQELAFFLAVVSQLVGETANGQVGLSALGKYLKEHHPAFSPKHYGCPNLLKMVKSFNELKLHQDKAEWQITLLNKK